MVGTVGSCHDDACWSSVTVAEAKVGLSTVRQSLLLKRRGDESITSADLSNTKHQSPTSLFGAA